MANYNTSSVETRNIGQTVDQIMQYAFTTRKPFERKWYDNQFFDDGLHFRYWSHSANKIIDVSSDTSIYSPMRAIPKASKQIRGIANLLTTNDPVPVIYPEKLNFDAFENKEEYEQARKVNKQIAKLAGHWVQEEFKKQEISENLALMLILAAKHGISYMQIWPDAVAEKIKTQVYDAFDIYIQGDVNSIYDSPFIIKGIPKTLAEIKANELFNQTERDKITPDNRLASSEIKEAYKKAKQGMHANPDIVATVIQKEYFLKEYLNRENKERVRSLNPDLLKTRKDGDIVIRHGFVAGDLSMYDEYIDEVEYPFVEYRYEPGPVYQVPLIERFIPSNKSLDVVVSRVERFINTMVTGFWMKKQGEQFKPTNIAGGVVYEYLSTPPTQGQITQIPGFVFNFMGLLTNFIEEQGVTMSTLSKIPQGVRSNAAIESLKESEYASLAVAQRRLKQTVKKIAERFLMIADDYFIKPQEVRFLEKGEPQYFDIIGKKALKVREQLGVPPEGKVIPISGDYFVDIEVETGLGFTQQGKREAMLKLVAEIFIPLAEKGYLPQAAIQTVVEKVAETYQFGATAELMESFEGQGVNFTEQQIEALKVAIAEVFKDMKGSGILPDEEQRIQEGQIATAQVVKDTGLGPPPPPEQKPPSTSIPFKDLPPSGKMQVANQAGIQLDPAELMRQEAREDAKTVIRDKGQQTKGGK